MTKKQVNRVLKISGAFLLIYVFNLMYPHVFVGYLPNILFLVFWTLAIFTGWFGLFFYVASIVYYILYKNDPHTQKKYRETPIFNLFIIEDWYDDKKQD